MKTYEIHFYMPFNPYVLIDYIEADILEQAEKVYKEKFPVRKVVDVFAVGEEENVDN